MVGALILAGGRGDRIGGNKALMELDGRSLISYVLEAASKVSDEIVVVIGREVSAEDFSSLPKGVEVVTDIEDGGGPLMGVYSGLNHLRSKYALVLPCDAPFISEDVLKHLILRAEGVGAVIPLWPNGHIEPLHSVYHVRGALRASEAAIEEGRFRIYNMIEKLERTIYVRMEELRKFDPDLLTFFNINSREDLNDAEAVLNLKNSKND